MDASPYYIRMRVPAWLFGSGASPVTTQFLTYVSNSYGTVLLQKRNMKRNRRTEIASGGRYEE